MSIRAIGAHFPAAAAAAALALVAVGCGDDFSAPAPAPAPFEYRELRVPIDESGQSAEALGLRYFWMNETERSDPPVLVFLFGGPGSSAVDFLTFLSTSLPDWVGERFALVGLDEVGVGGSQPIVCPSLGRADDEAYLHPFIASSSVALVEAWRDETTACREGYPYSSLIGTERHARDLERLRIELGVAELNFVSYSYGTRVALTYAALHPDRTGRLVLDSPVDPRSSYLEQLRLQALAREMVLDRFLDWCPRTEACGFDRQEFLGAIERLERKPPSFAIAFLLMLEDLVFEPQWPTVAAELTGVLADLDGAPQLVNSNATVIAPPAFVGTLCADWPVDGVASIVSETEALAAALSTDVPRAFFSDATNSAYGCLFWPGNEPMVRWEDAFRDLTPALDVLLVNAAADMLSPPSFAESLAEALPGAARVRIDEVSHAIGLQGLNDCVDSTIRTFLTEGRGEVTDAVDCPKSAFDSGGGP